MREWKNAMRDHNYQSRMKNCYVKFTLKSWKWKIVVWEKEIIIRDYRFGFFRAGESLPVSGEYFGGIFSHPQNGGATECRRLYWRVYWFLTSIVERTASVYRASDHDLISCSDFPISHGDFSISHIDHWDSIGDFEFNLLFSCLACHILALVRAIGKNFSFIKNVVHEFVRNHVQLWNWSSKSSDHIWTTARIGKPSQ